MSGFGDKNLRGTDQGDNKGIQPHPELTGKKSGDRLMAMMEESARRQKLQDMEKMIGTAIHPERLSADLLRSIRASYEKGGYTGFDTEKVREACEKLTRYNGLLSTKTQNHLFEQHGPISNIKAIDAVVTLLDEFKKFRIPSVVIEQGGAIIRALGGDTKGYIEGYTEGYIKASKQVRPSQDTGSTIEASKQVGPSQDTGSTIEDSALERRRGYAMAQHIEDGHLNGLLEKLSWHLRPQKGRDALNTIRLYHGMLSAQVESQVRNRNSIEGEVSMEMVGDNLIILRNELNGVRFKENSIGQNVKNELNKIYNSLISE